MYSHSYIKLFLSNYYNNIRRASLHYSKKKPRNTLNDLYTEIKVYSNIREKHRGCSSCSNNITSSVLKETVLFNKFSLQHKSFKKTHEKMPIM